MNIADTASKYPVFIIAGLGLLAYVMLRRNGATLTNSPTASVSDESGASFVSQSELANAMRDLEDRISDELSSTPVSDRNTSTSDTALG